MLLVGAGLLLRSLQRVLDVDPGFAPQGVLTARLRLAMQFVAPEPDWRRAVAVFEELEGQLEAIPGVRSATAAYQLPTDSGWNNAFEIDPAANPGHPVVELSEGESHTARFRPVRPGYFETAGIRLLGGRDFTDDDSADAPRVVIVNESLVREYFAPGANPIGARLKYANWWKPGPPDVEIVGVVQDVHFSGRTLESYRATYFPHAQQPVREMAIMLRADRSPYDLVQPLRDAVASVDPDLPVDDVSLLVDQLASHEASRRSFAVLLVIFAITALSLAAIGVYGVMASLVTQRTREMGIRVALGAQHTDVRWLVLRQALSLVVAGIAIGLLAALFLGRLLEQVLFEISPVDPVTLAAVSGFLALVALTASWVPARRATRVDPMESLRSD